MNRLVTFLREFRERRIFRYMVSYLATGWVVLEVIDHFIDRGVLADDLVYKIALIWYLVGVPAALIVGWFHGERGDQKAPRLEVLMLSVLGVICLGLSSTAVSSHMTNQLAVVTEESGRDLRRVAVLYFDDVSVDRAQQYLADGLTEGLISELAQVRTLDVISRNGVAPFRGADLPRDSIASVLNAGTVVDGAVEQVGDQVRITLRLIDGLSGAVFRRASFERPAGELLTIREEVVKETSGFLREWLGEEVRLRALARATESTAAWALYQRAERARKDAEELFGKDDHAGMARAFQTADSLLAEAEELDPAWAEPTVLRSLLAYRQARVAHDPFDANRWIERGLALAEDALRREPENARAMEARGTLRYFRYILKVSSDAEENRRLLQSARTDLETAVRLEPTLASAHSTLSHLYAQVGDAAAIVLAARRAYEEDAYLDMASEVLWRLFLGTYDLQQFTDTRRWCDEGGRRFPADHRFTLCQFHVMASPAGEADVDRAWGLLARLDSLAPGPRRAHENLRGQLYIAGILARAGMPDSARSVLSRAHSRIDHEVDPHRELLLTEAHMWTLLGDREKAIDALTGYAAANPRYSFEHSWRWNDLRSHPRFQALQAQAHAHAE